METQIGKGRWALVLGASSGIGEACVRALASAGYGIFGVHLDRRAGLQHVGELKAELTEDGAKAHFYNMNAADPDKMETALDDMASHMGEEEDVGVLMHSLAFGTLRRYSGENAVTPAQMDMTLRVMAHSLVDCTRSAIADFVRP